MKPIKVDLSADIKKINLEIFSDLHLGDKHCNIDIIRERIERVKKNENTYCILTGDIIDNATKTSIGDTYEEALSPMEQVKNATDLFKPIKDKILLVVSGNHCYRSYKTDGIDLMYFMCAELGITDKYDSIGALLFLRFGKPQGRNNRKMCYTIYATHGSGAGGTVGAKANRLEKIGNLINADVCVIGHTHLPMVFRESNLLIDYQNSSFYSKETVFVNASSALEWGGYAEKLSLKSGSMKSPIIILDGTHFNIDVII